jgi:EAL domain-containing protein (putative c-di-GMP-specific phosphodiesterase class I)
MQLIAQQETQPLNIRRILQHNLLEAFFQPVVSMTRQTVCGMEGLIRCTQTPIPPRALFDAAEAEGLTLQLDRQCRETILKAFSAVHARHPEKMLFLNVDASILDSVGGSGYLLGQVEKYHIPTNSIVLEINETLVRNAVGLGAFIRLNREAGFLLALDDVGAGFSNLDRIPLVKPDIIKIDISLVRHIESDYHRQEVFRSMVRLASRIGAVAVAEGVESEEEALTVLRLGAGMIQGFYFSRPQRMDESLFSSSRIEALAGHYKQFMAKRTAAERQHYTCHAQAVDTALHEMGCAREFDEALARVMYGCDTAECAYVLDELGVQCSNTVFHSGREGRQNSLFYSAQPGDDHSMKKYYYGLLDNWKDHYMTEPYVSLATGNLCVTFSGSFRDIAGKRRILCMDFKADSFI